MKNEKKSFRKGSGSFDGTGFGGEEPPVSRLLEFIPEDADEEEAEAYMRCFEGLRKKTESRDTDRKEGRREDWRDNGSLSAQMRYYLELQEIPRLTEQEERQIAMRSLAGDEEARHSLVTHHLKLVVFIARPYQSYGVDFEDLVQEGNIGLIHAAEKYDYRKNVRFSTYAVWWIRKYILRCVAEQGHSFPLSLQGHQDSAVLNKFQEDWNASGRRGMPTIPAMAEGTGLNPERIRSLLKANQRILSLETLGVNQEGCAATDPEEQADTCDPEEIAEKRFLHEAVRKMLNTALDRKTKHIVELRFGFLDGEARTLQQIGNEFGVSRERINVIVRESLEKLTESEDWDRLEGFFREDPDGTGIPVRQTGTDVRRDPKNPKAPRETGTQKDPHGQKSRHRHRTGPLGLE